MDKINIAELLRDCPTRMELDCTMYDKVTFEEVVTVRGFDDKERVKIILSTHYSDGTKDTINLTEFGTYTDDENAKCVIYPKGKTTWEGFHRPFVEGDIVSTESGIYIGIVKSTEDSHHCYVFCSINDEGDFFIDNNLLFSRFATEQEKAKLFKAIKDNDYRWDTETKTLEKLPKFKVGDTITNGKTYIKIGYIDDEYYYEVNRNIANRLFIKNQDEWNLVPSKFDINTLKPFESKVLVRNDESQRWLPAFWGYKVVDGFITTFGWCKYCIPYEGNEHLLNTSNEPNDFFKT